MSDKKDLENTNKSSAEKNYYICTLERGNHFGLEYFYNNEVKSFYSIQCKELSKVLRISKEKFLDILKSD